MIIYQKHIVREDLQRNPDVIYLFGDNLLHEGLGGQAKEMRGEINAIGIPTKYEPSQFKNAYFHDRFYEEQVKQIDIAFSTINTSKIIVIPADGLGTGLAMLPEKAPNTYEYLLSKIKELEKQ